MQSYKLIELSDFYQFDIFTILILLGVGQGLFLSILFLTRHQKQPYQYFILGIFSLSCALILLEVFLGYSGLITQVLFLVDFSEPLVFIIGPLLFLLTQSIRGKDFKPVNWLHFIPFILYFLYHLPFLLESDPVKFNSFLWAFHPDIPFSEAVRKFPLDPLYIRRNLDYFIVFHFGLYLTLIYYSRRKNNTTANLYFTPWINLFTASFLLITVLYIVMMFYYKNDLGDHLLAIFITICLFFITYKLLTNSAFFQPVIKIKYKKSSLDREDKHNIIAKLNASEQTEFYTDPSLSLAKLAKQLGTTSHYLSQVLNEEKGKTYFEYINYLKIQKAQKLLLDPDVKNFKIEEIAERSGYLSKSAFSTNFKKIMGTTPGEFRKLSENKSSAL